MAGMHEARAVVVVPDVQRGGVVAGVVTELRTAFPRRRLRG